VSSLGLLGVDTRVVWGVVAILGGIVLGRALRWYGKRLDERRPSEERELMQRRSRETMMVLVATAIPYATTIVVLVVLASFFLPAAALGGSAFIAVIVGFAAQRFLMDVMAGILIAFERWYAVGDFVMIEPSKAAGIVEQFGLRTTVLRALNGDRAYVPNSQIITAFWSPKGYRR
jgi:moderate conductance mechanosensitive channel